MNTLNFNTIFYNAFDTFKVFETIPFEISGINLENHTKTIWQTLNHLILWQKHQLLQLESIESTINFSESESWIIKNKAENSLEWQTKVDEFSIQIKDMKEIISNLNMSDNNLEEKLKIIQDCSTHLSFHLGEIILIGRQKNQYPQPHEMNNFLAN